MLALAWQYLTGRAVATHPTDRNRPEWPPHPDRVFQALVAAWAEAGQDLSQRAALEWLSALPPPLVAVPADVEPCAAPAVFVPVNDTHGPARGPYKDAHLGLLPECRARKERRFPAVFAGDGVCALVWPDADPGQHRAPLEALCRTVTRIGHSSSLVRAFLTDSPPEPSWVPLAAGDERGAELRLRVPGPGRLAQLVEAYADGKEHWERPPPARWHAYARPAPEVTVPQTVFDPRLIILRRVAGERRFALGGAQVPRLVESLRKALIAAAERTGSAVAKAVFSGHTADGSPAQCPHAACFPLPFVGAEHADGHLLGLAIALPRGLPRPDEDACYRALAEALDPETNALRLTCGAAGAMSLVYEDRDTPLRPWALRPETWTHPARCWATVTPIVLDRFPPKRGKDADHEAVSTIAMACARIGLPLPARVRVLPASTLTGSPAAHQIAPLRRKPDGARRWHVHAQLIFAVPVSGPVLLGAGRYCGYGLCKPVPAGPADVSPQESNP